MSKLNRERGAILGETGQGDLLVRHRGATFGDLRELVDDGISLERTAHVGNQSFVELALFTGLGVEPVLVNTIQGNDAYAMPSYVIVGGERYRVTSESVGRSRVVGQAPVDAERVKGIIDKVPGLADALSEMYGSQEDLHVNSLRKIDLSAGADPVTLIELITRNDDYANALFAALQEMGLLKRYVNKEGKIKQLEEVPEDPISQFGIYGLEDSTPADQGLLPPLEAMAASSIAYNLWRGQGNSYHLAGHSMKHYMRDPEVVNRINAVYTNTMRRLGRTARRVVMEVYDITRVGKLFTDEERASIGSQYDLLLAKKDRRLVVPEDKYGEPVFRTDR